MRRQTTRGLRAVACAATVVGALIGREAQAQRQAEPNPTSSAAPLPLSPASERGASITPAYEGWFANADGTFSLLIGYFNRNRSEALDIPAGPNNRIEPGPVDQGQPTHFAIGRNWGVFVIKVPADFGSKTLTWTIVSNGETQSIPFTLNKAYVIEPYQEAGMGNKPPEFRFVSGGQVFTGPPIGVATTLTAAVGQPASIAVAVNDPKETRAGSTAAGARRGAAGVATVSFHKFRGPGQVTFAPQRMPVKAQGESVTTAASFSAPGEYLVRVQGNDESGEGGGGFQCCWTNAYVKVTVK
jgi:hypothetical protein